MEERKKNPYYYRTHIDKCNLNEKFFDLSFVQKINN